MLFQLLQVPDITFYLKRQNRYSGINWEIETDWFPWYESLQSNPEIHSVHTSIDEKVLKFQLKL